MKDTIMITADDFGLTRGITDTILEVVDGGPVKRVSILVNGEAVEYALSEYKKRAASLTLALHLNLTEGRALSAPQDISHLVDVHGIFNHSIAGLWWSYLFGSHTKRAALRREVRTEIQAQCAVVRVALGTSTLTVNGHEHVHMIPFVFDELVSIPCISEVRIVREHSFLRGLPSLENALAYPVMRWWCSTRARYIVRKRKIRTNDWFVGFLYSGRMDQKVAQTGIARAGEDSVEVLFHPGSARKGELKEWRESRAQIAWHYARARQREREVLKKLNVSGQVSSVLG